MVFVCHTVSAVLLFTWTYSNKNSHIYITRVSCVTRSCKFILIKKPHRVILRNCDQLDSQVDQCNEWIVIWTSWETRRSTYWLHLSNTDCMMHGLICMISQYLILGWCFWYDERWKIEIWEKSEKRCAGHTRNIIPWAAEGAKKLLKNLYRKLSSLLW